MAALNLPDASGSTWALVIGAVLATAGGFAATQLERFVSRRERERSAALLFGEVLSALETVVEIAAQSSKRGDPYGGVTMRLLRGAQRECEAYDRNRGALYDLHDAPARIRIHVLVVRVSLALEGVFEGTTQIAELRRAMAELQAHDARREQLEADMKTALEARQTAFDYLVELTGEIGGIVGLLRPIAKVDFDALKSLSGNPFRDD